MGGEAEVEGYLRSIISMFAVDWNKREWVDGSDV